MKGALVVVRPTCETVLILTPGTGMGPVDGAAAPRSRCQNNRAAGPGPPRPPPASLAAATLCGREGTPVLFWDIGAPARRAAQAPSDPPEVQDAIRHPRGAAGRARHLPDQRDRLRRVLGRERQAGLAL